MFWCNVFTTVMLVELLGNLCFLFFVVWFLSCHQALENVHQLCKENVNIKCFLAKKAPAFHHCHKSKTPIEAMFLKVKMLKLNQKKNKFGSANSKTFPQNLKP